MLARFLIVLSGALLAATAVTEVCANPMPCPENSRYVGGQMVKVEIFDCGNESLGASIVRRRPTSEPVDVSWFDTDGALAASPCPPEGSAAVAPVTFKSCSQSFDGGEWSEGYGADYNGICFTETCVPTGRWQYVVEIGNDECFTFVVDIPTQNPECPVVIPDGETADVSAPDLALVDATDTALSLGTDAADSRFPDILLKDVSDVTGKVVTGPQGGGCSWAGRPTEASRLVVLLVVAGLLVFRRRSGRA